MDSTQTHEHNALFVTVRKNDIDGYMTRISYATQI